uniref:histone acetyltransferase n=1 Tax=Myotis myotis TaxID=51298 RepID=A0A7J7YF32_MYOMY|nr:hypothetical protein mMyoMyo1_011182 [Myotis myotis]
MSMSVMLHNQGQDPCHTCSECKQRIEVYWHCTECNDYNLCINCYNTKGHTHKMVKVGLGLDEEAKGGNEGGNLGDLVPRRPREPLHQSIQRCIQSLVHASQCRSSNCQVACQKMKHIVQHTKSCQRKSNGGCPVCKQFIALCCYHAKQCRSNPCPVPLCFHIKQSLRRQLLQLRQQLNKNELPQG